MMRNLKVNLIFVFFIFFSNTLHAYIQNPSVDSYVWEELMPYFLPENHPIKPQLDELFLKPGTTHTLVKLRKAGFKTVSWISTRHPIVAKHVKLKGYLVKLFVDEQPLGCEWVDWKKRIVGANLIRQAIDRHGYQNLFKVPQKWIYPLPSDSSVVKPGRIRKHFALVVEDMKIRKHESNYLFWRSVAMNPSRLQALFTLLQEEGLFDSVYPDNVPFCKDGTQAFVDTQHYHGWPVDFMRLFPFFRPQMQKRWSELIGTGG